MQPAKICTDSLCLQADDLVVRSAKTLLQTNIDPNQAMQCAG